MLGTATVDPFRTFFKDSARLVNRCTKPDAKGQQKFGVCVSLCVVTVCVRVCVPTNPEVLTAPEVGSIGVVMQTGGIFYGWNFNF